MIADEIQLDVTKAWVSRSLEHDRILTCCDFSPCGKYLFAVGQEENVQRWDLESGMKTSLVGHSSWVTSIAFHAETRRVLTADCHGGICCWKYDSEQPQPEWSVPQAHGGWIRDLCVTRDGNVLSAGNDLVVRLRSVEDGAPVRKFSGHKNYIFALAFHPELETFVSGDLFGQVRHWDYQTGELLGTFEANVLHTRRENFLADVGGVRSLAFDAKGKQLACGGMTDAKSNAFCPGNPAVLVFDWQSGDLLRTLRPKHKSDGPIKGLVFLADGTIAGHAEHLNAVSSLEFWNSGSPEAIHTIKRQSAYCLALHPNGSQLAAATFKPNGRIGNGRHSEPEKYASHNGEIAIFSLFGKPDAAAE